MLVAACNLAHSKPQTIACLVHGKVILVYTKKTQASKWSAANADCCSHLENSLDSH